MQEKILKLLGKNNYVPLTRSVIARHLKCKGEERIAFRRVLKKLVDDGKVVRIKGKRFGLPREVELVSGVLQCNRNGFGFVIPDDPELKDIYIHRENMELALDGDKVLVRPGRSRRRRGKVVGPEGEIVRVIKRGRERILGTLKKSNKFYFVVPDNPAIYQHIYVDKQQLKGADIADKVAVKISYWESPHQNPEGKILRVLGKAGELETELLSIIEKYGFPKRFNNNVTAEVKEISPEIPRGEINRREDLRGQTIFTVDPEDAKDFDDAVSLEKKGKGWVLGVHIADVGFYVNEGSALDEEARKRGNSVYLYHRFIPMLPKGLSGDLCSLIEGRDRLAKSVFMTINPQGKIKEYRIVDSIIRSSKRFTFDEVNEIAADKINSTFKPLIDNMVALAGKLNHQRRLKGALDFELEESKVVLDENNEIKSIGKRGKNLAESLIEEFMLAANETVGIHLEQYQRPVIYRVHDQPDVDQLNDFVRTIRAFGYSIPPFPTSAEIQDVLDQVKGKSESYIINFTFLRSLKVAEYSTKNIGHYGLATRTYVHFTSPIRRYPDLITHRLLDSVNPANKKSFKLVPATVREIAKHSSATERAGDSAERDLDSVAKFIYLDRLIKKEGRPKMSGIIRRINRYGISVWLTDLLIEGSVSLSTLVDDYYRYDRRNMRLVGVRKQKTFKPGQHLNVRIMEVDFDRRVIHCLIVG
jgi:ribonuclease R